MPAVEPTQYQMKYRADIDGLRALAVIPVVLFHTNFSWFRGGFVGVDIFFVISGYLITTIIHEEIQQDRFTIAGFYERRIRRIFPALFTVILFCFIVAAYTMLPKAFELFGQSVNAATLFVANIYFLTGFDYFGPAADTQPLLHTWSLSVEEQFYVLFPLLLVFIFTSCHGRWRRILLPAALLSLALSIFSVHIFPSASFYLLPTRGWELLLGAFIALDLFPPYSKQWARDMTSILGLGLILWSILFFSKQTPFPGWHALFPCIGAALIIHAGREQQSAAGRLLSARIPVFIGLISYSLYLWHWPLMVFEKQIFYDQHFTYSAYGVVSLSFILAILSWRYVERPFRKRSTPQQRRKLFAAAAGIMTVFIAAGVAVDAGQGLPGRFGNKLIALKCDLAAYNLGTCFLREDQDFSQWSGEQCFLQTDKPANTLLWGDSFAAHYVPGIKAAADRLDSNILQYTAGGCAPAFAYDPAYRPKCKKIAAQVNDILKEYDIQSVILAAAWKMALDNGLRFKDLQQTVETLRDKGLRVVLIGQSPRFAQSVQDISNRAAILGQSVVESPVAAETASINRRLREIVGTDNFVDPSALFCNGRTCRFRGKEGFYFWDDGHMTLLGSREAAEYIFSQIKI